MDIIKGLLIDPENQTISEVELMQDAEGTMLESIYEHLNCSCVDVARQLLTHLPSSPTDDVWFDYEASFSDCPYTFLIPGYIPLIGRGLILNYDDEGYCVSHMLTQQDIEVLRSTIRWYKREIVN
jgi:hypothetical protein